MRSTERAEFGRLLDALCAGFNQPSTPERADGYWRGLANMQLPAFERTVDFALGELGPDRLPTAPQLWRLYRELQSAQRKLEQQATAPAQGELGVPHEFELHATQVLLSFLRERARAHGAGASPDSLSAILAAKKRLVAAYRIICEDEPAACSELRDALIEAFQQAFVPAQPGDYSYPIRCAS